MNKIIEKFPYYQVKTTDNFPLFNIWSTDRIIINSEKRPRFFNTNSHVHTNLELSFITCGEGMLCVENVNYPIKRGDLIFIRNLESHSVVPISDKKPLGIIDIIFTPTNASKFASEFFSPGLVNEFYSKGKGNSILAGNDENVVEIGKLMCEMEAEFMKEKPNVYLAKSMFVTILARLSDIFTDNTDFVKTNPDHALFINDIMKFINENITEDISLKILADEVKLDVSHFTAVFKSIQGIAPWEYVINERIALALKYLNEDDPIYSIAKVAELSGFKNLSNFNRIFKKKMGMTPSEFKKQRKNRS